MKQRLYDVLIAELGQGEVGRLLAIESDDAAGFDGMTTTFLIVFQRVEQHQPNWQHLIRLCVVCEHTVTV